MLARRPLRLGAPGTPEKAEGFTTLPAKRRQFEESRSWQRLDVGVRALGRVVDQHPGAVHPAWSGGGVVVQILQTGSATMHATTVSQWAGRWVVWRVGEWASWRVWVSRRVGEWGECGRGMCECVSGMRL